MSTKMVRLGIELRKNYSKKSQSGGSIAVTVLFQKLLSSIG